MIASQDLFVNKCLWYSRNRKMHSAFVIYYRQNNKLFNMHVFYHSSLERVNAPSRFCGANSNTHTVVSMWGSEPWSSSCVFDACTTTLRHCPVSLEHIVYMWQHLMGFVNGNMKKTKFTHAYINLIDYELIVNLFSVVFKDLILYVIWVLRMLRTKYHYD